MFEDKTNTGRDRLGADGDLFYSALMDAHDGLTEAQSHALNMRLILVLANEIGDVERLKFAIAAARDCA